MLHGEGICCCGNNSLFFAMEAIYLHFLAVFTFTATILPDYGR